MEFAQETFEVLLGYGSFAWVVPESKSVARIGLVAYQQQKEEFQRFMRDRANNALPIAHQGGLIPVYDPKFKTEQDKWIYIIGDAATHVKAPSFGGIIQSLIAAECCAEAILEGKSYTKLLKKRLRTDLKHSLWIRKMMDKFSPEDFNELLSLVQKPKTKEIIETYERDKPSKMMLPLLLSQPKLLKYLAKLF